MLYTGRGLRKSGLRSTITIRSRTVSARKFSVRAAATGESWVLKRKMSIGITSQGIPWPLSSNARSGKCVEMFSSYQRYTPYDASLSNCSSLDDHDERVGVIYYQERLWERWSKIWCEAAVGHELCYYEPRPQAV